MGKKEKKLALLKGRSEIFCGVCDWLKIESKPLSPNDDDDDDGERERERVTQKSE